VVQVHRIAYFVSPHGFGHAARSTAVMAALQRRMPGVAFELFTRVPEWFFADSHLEGLTYHDCLTDIGLVQTSPLHEDLDETVRRLAEFLPFNSARLDALAGCVAQQDCELVLCDISPLGIAVAQRAGLPAVLIENFTWDWIYAGYTRQNGQMKGIIDYLAAIFTRADYRIQTEPVCEVVPADLHTVPVSRAGRTPRPAVRRALGIPDAAKAILVTMGGIPPSASTALAALTRRPDVYFVLPGGAAQVERRDNLVLLPHHSDFYHPDLIEASDAVIGKVGYSTIAEVYHAGVPFGYLTRQNFRESGPLSAYIQSQMAGFEIGEADFLSGDWLARLDELLALPRLERAPINGADQIAAFVAPILAARASQGR